MVIRDLLQQALSMTGVRLFDELEFDALRRMQFAVLSSDNEVIDRIQVTDNSGFSAEYSGDEAEIIRCFNEQIKIIDPDFL